MKEVDARGLSCPEPLMLTAEALKGETGPVKILVTEPHQKMNVEKFAKSKGKKSTAMEKVCKERNVPGRLIPVPRAISAGCGLSWCADLTDREQILDVMKEVGIEQEDVHECLV